MWDLFEMVNVWHEKMNMKKYWFSFWFFFFQNQKNINSKLKPNHYSFDLERILAFWCWYCCDCWCGGERSKCRRWLLTYWRQSGSRGSFTITQRWRCARTFSKVNACVCVRVCCVAYMLMWCDVMWCVLCFQWMVPIFVCGGSYTTTSACCCLSLCWYGHVLRLLTTVSARLHFLWLCFKYFFFFLQCASSETFV